MFTQYWIPSCEISSVHKFRWWKLIRRLRKVKWKKESQGSETKGLLRTVHVLYYSRNKGFAKDFPAHPLQRRRVRRSGAITTFRRKFPISFFVSSTREVFSAPCRSPCKWPTAVPGKMVVEQRDPRQGVPSSVKIINGVSKTSFPEPCDDNSFLFFVPLVIDLIIICALLLTEFWLLVRFLVTAFDY